MRKFDMERALLFERLRRFRCGRAYYKATSVRYETYGREAETGGGVGGPYYVL